MHLLVIPKHRTKMDGAKIKKKQHMIIFTLATFVTAGIKKY
jgi:hypothetical protein